ncbi:MAG: ATP-binding cassette domain-containing protein [Defluviitaleaceae bacterium]|nr:ATP-binding cassette domain-containing protein [Defluviitaleaceae bacterium]
MDNTAVSIRGVSKRFKRHQVFDNFSLDLPGGCVVGVLGENGIGKTTILRMIAGLSAPDAGQIFIQDKAVSRHTRDLVSLMLEPEQIGPYMKVSDAIAYNGDFYVDFSRDIAAQLCADFGIDTGARMDEMSAGMKERACLMLCLARRAKVYLLDEPMAGFDPKFKREIVKAILAYVEPWQTLIISTHLLRDLDAIFDEVVIITRNAATSAKADDIRDKGISIEDYYMEVVG